MTPSKCDPNSRRTLAALCLITITTNASYAAIAPILPLEIAQYSISERWISLIFLAFSIGSSIAPPIVASRLEKTGTVAVVVLSMVVMGILFWCLGHVFDLAEPVGSDNRAISDASRTIIVALLTVTQFFLGAFFSAITTGYYSAATSTFAENKESAMSYIEASVGAGYILGPIAGSAIYDWRGYRSAYTFISFVMMFMAFVTWKFLAPYLKYNPPEKIAVEDAPSDEEAPKRLFSSYSSLESISSTSSAEREPLNVDEAEGNQVMQHQPTTISLLRIPKLLFTATNILWINVSWTFLEPLLANRLDNLQVEKKMIGIIFSLSNMVYVPTVFLLQFIPRHRGKNNNKNSNNIWRHRIIWIATMLTPIAVLLVGSDNFALVITGITLLGLLPTPVWIMLLPFMQEECHILFPDPNMKQCVNDVSAGIYNSFMTLGQVVGYLIGPLMVSYGFVRTTHVVALLIFFQSMMFYFFCTDGNYSKQRRRRSPASDVC